MQSKHFCREGRGGLPEPRYNLAWARAVGKAAGVRLVLRLAIPAGPIACGRFRITCHDTDAPLPLMQQSTNEISP